MTPRLLNTLVIQPVLGYLDWPQREERTILLLAIAMQESYIRDRRQRPRGPGRSWWQIEPPTALSCLKREPWVREFWGTELHLTGMTVSYQLEFSELGACAVAAGILRLTPGKLPEVGDMAGAWEYYLKAWRSGKPGPGRWSEAYQEAMEAV